MCIERDSIRPKFPEIPVQNRMEQKVSGNSFQKFRSTFQAKCQLVQTSYIKRIKFF